MVGGRVTSTDILKHRVQINTTDGRDHVSIFVEKDAKARTISLGDHVWWQGREAFWTPTPTESMTSGATTGPHDVTLAKIGASWGTSKTKDPGQATAHA